MKKLTYSINYDNICFLPMLFGGVPIIFASLASCWGAILIIVPFVSIALIICACYEINREKTDYTLNAPSDAYRFLGLDYHMSEETKEEKAKKEKEYEEYMAFYLANRNYCPINRMTKFDVFLLLAKCIFWPLFVVKLIIDKINEVLIPVKKTLEKFSD